MSAASSPGAVRNPDPGGTGAVGEEASHVSIDVRQRTHPLDRDRLADLVLELLRHRRQVGEIGFHFVSAREMARVNWDFLRHEGSTDVITFDHGSGKGRLHGECFISVPDAVGQAEEFGRPWTEELARYVIHGVLHLEGFDDLAPETRRVMKRHENRLVAWANRKFDLGKLHRPPRAPGRRGGRKP
jgi:rRNA maturation RNase YbeY